MKPFTPQGNFYDSSMAGPEYVEHTTSWLTINPFKGCSLGCAYCFRLRWGASDVPIAEYDVDEAVEDLLSHPEFVPHETPVSINISSTDALLPAVKRTTFRCCELLEGRKLRNPFGITTKLSLGESDVRLLRNLRYVRPIVFVSLALLPKHIEPVPVRHRIENLRRLKGARVPSVLYFRPIVPGWNDTPKKIETLLALGETYCNGVCIGGLRLSPEIEHSLSLVGARSPAGTEFDFHAKSLTREVEALILKIYELRKLTVPLFKHTSCAVSEIIKRPNYNGLFRDPAQNCMKTCPKAQQARCENG